MAHRFPGGRRPEELRRVNPGRDLLSAIGTVNPDGVLLNDMEVGTNAVMFIRGGPETTRNAISGGVLELI